MSSIKHFLLYICLLISALAKSPLIDYDQIGRTPLSYRFLIVLLGFLSSDSNHILTFEATDQRTDLVSYSSNLITHLFSQAKPVKTHLDDDINLNANIRDMNVPKTRTLCMTSDLKLILMSL